MLGFYLLWCLCTGSIHVRRTGVGTIPIYAPTTRKPFVFDDSQELRAGPLGEEFLVRVQFVGSGRQRLFALRHRGSISRRLGRFDLLLTGRCGLGHNFCLQVVRTVSNASEGRWDA